MVAVKKMKKRIAVVSRMERAGGGSFQYGASILEAVTKLPQNEYEVCFWYNSNSLDDFVKKLCCQHAKPNWLYVQFFRVIRKIANIANKVLKSARIENWVEYDALIRAVRAWKPDVCISLEQTYNPLSKEVRVIGPVHDLMHRYETLFPEIAAPAEYALREKTFGRHAKHAAAVLVDSAIGKAQLIESYGVAENRVHILPFIPSPLLTESSGRPASFATITAPFIFYPAQFWPHKNHMAIIQAIAMLPENLPLHCVFVGTTDKEAFVPVREAMEKAGLRERVHILGYVSDADVAWFYKNAFALVMATFCGPTNIPPLEAMQYGCPVIVSEVYGMPEQCGDAALYIDPRKPEQIVEALCRIATEPGLRDSLIEKGYARSARWTKKDFQKRFLEILQSVCSAPFHTPEN